jgi:Tol biopolymer transport system component
MTPGRDNLDKAVATWLREQTGTSSVGYADETLELIDRTPQRRWRATVLRAVPIPAAPRVPYAAAYLGFVALLVVALVAAAVLIGSQRRLPPPIGPAANGLIAYDDGRSLFVARSDGSQAVQIRGGFGFDDSGIFSPDGTLIAFVSSRGHTGGFPFVANSDGTGAARQLGLGTVVDGWYLPPTWSPDSASIAYAAWRPKGPRGIFVASVQTGEASYVAGAGDMPDNQHGWDPRRVAAFPAWSPDGRWIAYHSFVGPRTRLMIVRPDGSGQRELVSVEGDADAFNQMTWSPDSSAVAYHRPHGASGGLVVATFDLAHGERQISRPDRSAHSPTWSTDGTRIAYIEERLDAAEGTNGELMIATADGRDVRSLGEVVRRVSSWSPDSQFLIGYNPVENPSRPGSEVVIVPIDGRPVRAVPLPGEIFGTPTWQRVAAP